MEMVLKQLQFSDDEVVMQVIARGDRGNEVVDIQTKLSMLGYNLGFNGADGRFGEMTEAAVRQFQHDRSLAQTGVVDQETWKVLVEATYKLGDRLLYLRMPFFRGDDIRDLQLSLNTLGFNTGQVDGIFGQTTERAVREFQRNMGLPSDGIFGPSTLAALRNLQHLLMNKASCVFPDPHRNQHSMVSIFHGKKIAIDLAMQNGDSRVLAFTDEEEISHDLGLRLGNLLELLGARVLYLDKIAPGDPGHLNDPENIVELYIGFKLNAASNGSSRGSTIFYQGSRDEAEARSKALAASIQQEIIRTLGFQDLGIKSSDFKLRIGTAVPATLIKPLFITNSEEEAFLGDEEFRQKIAVAVFDGISNYLQLS